MNKMIEKYSLLICDFVFSLASVSTLNEALKVVLETVKEIDEIHCAGIYLINPDTGFIELIISSGLSEQFIGKTKKYDPSKYQFKLVSKGKSIFGNYSQVVGDPGLFRREKLNQIGVIPLKDKKGQVIGSLNVGSREHGEINKEVKLALEMIAAHIGGAIACIKSQHDFFLSQKNFKLIFDAIDDFLFILDTNGGIIKTNPVVKKRLGYTPEELHCMNILDIHPPDRREEVDCILREIRAGRRKICTIPLYSKDGCEIPVETKVVDGKWDDKKACYGISRDISERKEYENSLAKALRKEKELNELKSYFVSKTSHEFRTPLSIMLMAAETLENYFDRMTKEERGEKIKRIKCNIKFLTKVIEKVLDLSHLESGKMKFEPVKIDLNEFLTSIINENSLLPNIKHQIEFSKPETPVNINIDKQMIREVINNIISNSFKYSPEGSVVQVELKHKTTDAIIHISDHGIGIPEKDSEKIFEPFSRGSNVASINGTGLGLALSRQFVSCHGGEITYNSRCNGGTTFTIILPAITE